MCKVGIGPGKRRVAWYWSEAGGWTRASDHICMKRAIRKRGKRDASDNALTLKVLARAFAYLAP